MTIEHATWTIERSYPVPVERVFAAWSDVTIKRRWFVGPDDQLNENLNLDFCVGGVETTSGVTHDGKKVAYEAVYRDIVENQRIITAYEMSIEGRRISVSLASVELSVSESGTRLIYTEQGAYLDGLEKPGGRRGGVSTHLDNLGSILTNRTIEP